MREDIVARARACIPPAVNIRFCDYHCAIIAGALFQLTIQAWYRVSYFGGENAPGTRRRVREQWIINGTRNAFRRRRNTRSACEKRDSGLDQKEESTRTLIVSLSLSLLTFSEPNFVGSYDIGSHVFFFFRETAVEYINCGKSVYSRVARVCKRDTGGKNILAQNWATYLKARLNCSIPGEFPFYFNEIREYRDARHESRLPSTELLFRL